MEQRHSSDLNSDKPTLRHATIPSMKRRMKGKDYHERTIYMITLVVAGRLYSHMAEIDHSCAARLETMIPTMAAAEGVDEALKARDQLAWAAAMNSIRHRAEESILAELIFD